MNRAEAIHTAKAAGWDQWVRSEVDIKAVCEGCYFDIDSAVRVKEFFEKYLRFDKGTLAHRPYAMMPWQWERIIAPLFGWKRPDATRRFREAFVFVPKKNDKSGLCSGLADYFLLADKEISPLVLLAAYDKGQAGELYRTAWNLLKWGPLKKFVRAIRHSKTMLCEMNDGILRALSKDSDTAEGLNWSCCIFDELHTQRNSDMWDSLRYGKTARKQPLLISITTAGDDKQSLCYSRYDYARRVASVEIEDIRFLPVLYEPTPAEAADWMNPAVWRKCNPALGTIFSEADMRADAEQASHSLRETETYKRYRLNVWTSSSETKWLDTAKWQECKTDIDLTVLYGKPCVAALDLSQKIDLTALVLVWKDKDMYTVLPYFWTPRETAVERERVDGVPYREWEKKGIIEFTQGDSVDFVHVRQRIQQLRQQFSIQEIVFDTYASGETIQRLVADGAKCVPMAQNISSLSEPSKTLEKLIIDKQICHNGNACMDWMIDNVQVYTDSNGNIRPVRFGDKGNRNKRIDGVVCLVMALARWAISDIHTTVNPDSFAAQMQVLQNIYR